MKWNELIVSNIIILGYNIRLGWFLKNVLLLCIIFFYFDILGCIFIFKNEKEEIIKIIFFIFIKLVVNIGLYINGKICFFKIYLVGIFFKIVYFIYLFCFCDIIEFFKILV